MNNEEFEKMKKMIQTKIEEQKIDLNQNDWIKEEFDTMENEKTEKLPSLKFEEFKITEFEVIFGSERFPEWIDHKDGKVKKIIPVIHNGEKKNLWLNKKNPLYYELIKQYLFTQNNHYRVIQIGNKDDTKYQIIN